MPSWVLRRFTGASFASFLVVIALLAGCASSPLKNSVATVAVHKTLTLDDLKAQYSGALREQQSLRAAGVSNDLVAAGRVVSVHCAMMSDGTWGGLGILPVGVKATPGSVWRLQVEDIGTNERDFVNPILGPVPELSWSGRAAYTFVPNWRELGRWSNLDPVELPKDQRGHYKIVFSHFLVSCRQ